MVTVELSESDKNHIQRLVSALAMTGWRASSIPSNGKLKSNRQCIEFDVPTHRLKVRFSVFSVGDRGESHRRDERRIQITTTFQSGLERIKDHIDIVLGYDSDTDSYVGLDARRLEYGGEKHNASSSVDSAALEMVSDRGILVRPHETQLLGLEYQAIFKPQKLAEYVFSADSIHHGMYVGGGLFSKPSRTTYEVAKALTVSNGNAGGDVLVLETQDTRRSKAAAKKAAIIAYENGELDSLKEVTPEELESIRRKCAEIGDRGELYVFRSEKQRLRKAGRADLAKKVDWVSRRCVGEGYDIGSFEVDGQRRCIEVKTTIGHGMTFVITNNEWSVAEEKRSRYYIYRVIKASTAPEIARIVKDPVSAERNGIVERTPDGWRIRIV